MVELREAKIKQCNTSIYTASLCSRSTVLVVKRMVSIISFVYSQVSYLFYLSRWWNFLPSGIYYFFDIG